MPRAAWLLAALLLSGCAASPAARTQDVTVEVVNAPGVACTGEDLKGGKYHWPKTPASAPLPRLGGPINLTCEAEGFKPLSFVLTRSEESGRTPRETFFFFPPAAAAADLLQGGPAARLQYPSRVRLLMEPVPGAPEEVKRKYREFIRQHEREALGR